MRRAIPFPEKVSVEAPETSDSSSPRTRYDKGWRAGKPVEDPEKTKSWGFVTAKPSEYLIHMRRGKVRPRSSGQGASCFKLPWDSIAIIPTTLNRLQFTADQVTREKVGVEVTGLAVFRITDPEMTYKMLNFSFAERATEKLESTLREMFMGSVRRIVAGMSVEDVLTRRKEGLAEEIMREIAPVVSGRGKETDRTNRGWGVVIDTIEIQDVRVLSESVFANMQALFRNQLLLQARDAELSTARAIAERETSNAKEIAESRITAESATRELKAIAESHAAEIELAEQVKREKSKGEAGKAVALAAVERARVVAMAESDKERDAQLAVLAREQAVAEGKRAVEEARFIAEREKQERTAELERWATEAKIERERAEAAARMQLAREEADTRGVVRERELAMERLTGETANALALGSKQIENLVTTEAIQRDLVLKTMPAIAAAFAASMGETKFVHFGGSGGAGGEGGADPISFVTRAIAQVLEVARSQGIEFGGKKEV